VKAPTFRGVEYSIATKLNRRKPAAITAHAHVIRQTKGCSTVTGTFGAVSSRQA